MPSFICACWWFCWEPLPCKVHAQKCKRRRTQCIFFPNEVCFYSYSFYGGRGIRAILIPIEFWGKLSLTPKIIKAVITKLSFTIIPRAKLVSHISKIISVLSIPHSYSHFARVTCKILNKLLLLVSHVFNARVIFRIMQTACSILSPTQKYCAIARHPCISFFRLLFHGRLFIDTCMCRATWELTSFALKRDQ